MNEIRAADSFFAELVDVPRPSRAVVTERSPDSSPAALYDALVYGTGSGSEFAARYEVVAWPGESIVDRLRGGDRLLRRAVGEGRLANVSLVVDGALLSEQDAGAAGLALEPAGPGFYVAVEDERPWSAVAGSHARRIAGSGGLLAPHQIVIRERTALGQVEDSYDATDEADDGEQLGEAFGSDHVRIVLHDDDGRPAAGVRFEARFRNGRVVRGRLDARGEATIPDHTYGDVTVTFPDLAAAAWQIDSFGDSHT